MPTFLILAVVPMAIILLMRALKLDPFVGSRGRRLTEIGREALGPQPDRIHLSRMAPHAWKNAEAARRLAEPLLFMGFDDVGTFGIAEIPGITVRMMVKGEAKMYATIYEHPRAEPWLDLITHYEGGAKVTFTTLEDPGLPVRPGHTIVRGIGCDALALCDRALEERPKSGIREIGGDEVVPMLEHDYAEWRDWMNAAAASGIETGKQSRKAA